MDEIFLIFANTLNVTCCNNLRSTRSITSAVFSALSEPASARRTFAAQRIMPFIPNANRSTGFLSLHPNETASQYAVEYDAEYVRSREFPMLPSRLSALYAFSALVCIISEVFTNLGEWKGSGSDS